ncbi:MAG TPA: DUF1540 domain-containing protein [Kofleriaceae bacterium]
MRITIEMPKVEECDAIGCAYNVDRACHARAITVGHGVHPGCDTYLSSGQHVPDGPQCAGVGACKVAVCRHNRELECTAPSIRVGVRGDAGECGTFEKR